MGRVPIYSVIYFRPSLGLGSKTKTASGDRSVFVAGSGSKSALGYGLSTVAMADCWLGSGSGVVLIGDADGEK